jgi:hypothetical protein
LESKRAAWLNWKDTRSYLSQLFGYQIPHFFMLVQGKEVSWAKQLDQLIQEVTRDVNHGPAGNVGT